MEVQVSAVSVLASVSRALLFLGIPALLGVFYLQYRWAKTCRTHIQVLVAQQGGGGAYLLAPKDGGTVNIKNPATGEMRSWPVNELATIDVPYPGVGFVPAFMQKNIRLAIVNEGDVEPMLNRSPHRRKLASPDVVAFLREVAERSNDDSIRDAVDNFLGDVSTGPTRELVADPAALGALMSSTILRAVATVTNDLTDALRTATQQMARIRGASPTLIYVGLGLVLALLGFVLVKVVPMLTDLQLQMETVSVALGVATPLPP